MTTNRWVLYHSPLCPDCPPVQKRLEVLGADVEPVDITGSMAALKRFLVLRDAHEAFGGVRAQGAVGIPALVKDEGAQILIEPDEQDLSALPKR